MQFNCRRTISRMGLLLGFKTSKVMDFFVVSNLRFPRFFFHPFKENNTFKIGFGHNFSVGHILSISSLPKIAKSIVRFDHINVINLVNGPFFGNVKPSKPMSGIMLSVNFKVNIPSAMKVSGFFSNPDFWARFNPNKITRIFIVRENAQKFIMRNFFHANNIQDFIPYTSEKITGAVC